MCSIELDWLKGFLSFAMWHISQPPGKPNWINHRWFVSLPNVQRTILCVFEIFLRTKYDFHVDWVSSCLLNECNVNLQSSHHWTTFKCNLNLEESVNRTTFKRNINLQVSLHWTAFKCKVKLEASVNWTTVKCNASW